MPPMIEVQGLSKRYDLGHTVHHTSNLREILVRKFSAPFKARTPSATVPPRQFWALHNVSFEVPAGQIVGIIGANGAGKSTLLKILSRITDPTEGRITLRGRMASLLEVGTGFHPELTGRENIYMNGAVLGMRHAEIRDKFDEIVEFAEIAKFLDTPVKHYSSGMSVRLGFAVAAHLQPEILIVDEVLAVGDTAFQRKCLGKMSEVSRSGRTVLFVSHNMAAVGNLCQRGIVLKHGKLIYDGETKGALSEYLALSNPETGEGYQIDLLNAPTRKPQYQPILQLAELFTTDGQPAPRAILIGEAMELRIHLRLTRTVANFVCAITINSLYGERILTLNTLCDPNLPKDPISGDTVIACHVPSLPLAVGQYLVSVVLDFGKERVDAVYDAFVLNLLEADFFGTGKAPFSGVFAVPHTWTVNTPKSEAIPT